MLRDVTSYTVEFYSWENTHVAIMRNRVEQEPNSQWDDLSKCRYCLHSILLFEKISMKYSLVKTQNLSGQYLEYR